MTTAVQIILIVCISFVVLCAIAGFAPNLDK